MIIKKFNKVKDDYKRIQSEVDGISEELTIVENELNGTVTSRHTRAVDSLTVVDADSTATACGPYVRIFLNVSMSITEHFIVLFTDPHIMVRNIGHLHRCY